MGLTLATVLLAVPLAAWLAGTFLKNTPHLRLAQIPFGTAREVSHSWYSKTTAAAGRGSHLASMRGLR